MIRTAFCDDGINTLGEMQVFFDQYRRERNREIAYTAFHGPIELTAEMERGTLFGVLFPDILMPGENGIETAAESTGSLDELSRRPAPCGCFLRPHCSYLIRLGYVRNVSCRAVTTSSPTEIPVPRGEYAEIKDAFLAHAFQNGQVQL
nr:hypothetical protein [uncultured Oscillibacter sp.]